MLQVLVHPRNTMSRWTVPYESRRYQISGCGVASGSGKGSVSSKPLLFSHTLPYPATPYLLLPILEHGCIEAIHFPMQRMCEQYGDACSTSSTHCINCIVFLISVVVVMGMEY